MTALLILAIVCAVLLAVRHAGGAGCDCQDDKGAGMIDLMDWWDWAVGVMLAWLLAWRWSWS